MYGFVLSWAVLRLSFRQQFAYLPAIIWGLITNFFFGILNIAVLLALFGQKKQVAGFDLQDAITYVALTQFFIASFSLFGSTDFMRSIHQGEIAIDLLRPMSLLNYWASQDAGRALGQLILRGLPMLILFVLFWQAQMPSHVLATIISILLAWACGFLFRFLVNCAAFWSANATGIGRFAWAILGFSCGFLMPLAFFPEWLSNFLDYTPFPSMLNSTVEIWLGRQTGLEMWILILKQAFWCFVLFLIASFILNRGLKRLEVAGG